MNINRTAYCFDLDGVITSEEILPIVAREIGYYEEINALTKATIQGIIPFESSFRLRCKILSEIPISHVRKIVSQINLHMRLLRFIESNSANCFLVTGNLDVWIADLVKKIGITAFSSTAEYEGDTLRRLKTVLNKSEAIDSIRLNFDRIVAIGDGMGDVPMFENADVRIAFGAVHPPIESLVQLSDFVCLSEESLCQTLNTL